MSTAHYPESQIATRTDIAKVPWVGGGMLRESARASDSYGLLLSLVIIDYILLSVGWEGGLADVVRTTFFGITAVFGVRTSEVRGSLLRLVIGASGAALIASVVSALVGGDASRSVTLVALAILALVTPIAVLYRILRHREVTAETILGAICAYVLLGLLFAYADLAVQAISSGRFFSQPGTHNEADFVYYSFITFTTVGYGDLSPTTGVPRTMAVTEALVGQIFLVVLVARLVSAYIPRSVEARRRDLIRAHAGRDPGSSKNEGDEVYEIDDDSEPMAGKDAGNGGET